MKLRGLARSLIFVRTEHPVPALRRGDAMLVGTGTRVVPTVYDSMRAQRRRRLLIMGLCIGLPTLLACLYYGLFASYRFVSTSQLVLSEQRSSFGGLSGGGEGKSLLAMVGISGGGGDTNESAIVTEYLQSVEAMEALDREIGLRRIWSAGSIDFLSRLPSDASQEDFHLYFTNHVMVMSDPMRPVIELRTEAFAPAEAQLIAKSLVRLAQEKLNSAFLRMREDALDFARSEVTVAEKRLARVNEDLRTFRNVHREIDPTAGAQAVGSVAGALFAQLASAEADLRTTQSYARNNSAPIKALQARIAALKEQIAADRGLLAGDASKKPYANLLADYENLLIQQKYAQDSYTAAMAFLEKSRTDLMRQQSYLIDFLSPTLPDQATEPKGMRNVLLVFLASLLIWLTGSLLISALREHAAR
jgi:capsular polysaccharide transport system permease protein